VAIWILGLLSALRRGPHKSATGHLWDPDREVLEAHEEDKRHELRPPPGLRPPGFRL